MAKRAIESRRCSTFGVDAHARMTAVKDIDRSAGVTAAKRFDDVPAPSEMASWMQGEFTDPRHAAYESGCTGFHLCRERKNDRRAAWAGRIGRCLAADTTVKEWCALNKVAEFSPHKWMDRFREEDTDRNVGPLSCEPIPVCRKGPSNVARFSIPA